MNKMDFVNINERYRDFARKLMERKGICEGLDCCSCPFSFFNSPEHIECRVNYSGDTDISDINPGLVYACKEFIDLFEMYWRVGGSNG